MIKVRLVRLSFDVYDEGQTRTPMTEAVFELGLLQGDHPVELPLRFRRPAKDANEVVHLAYRELRAVVQQLHQQASEWKIPGDPEEPRSTETPDQPDVAPDAS
jgi:hypothetical protein